MTLDLWCLVFLTLWSLPLIYLPPVGKMRAAGVGWGFGNRDTDPAPPAWVGRAERAARNHFENLPLFAIVVLVLHVTGKHDDVSGWVAVVYCAARVAHAVLYWTGVTTLGLRTIAHYVSLGALLVLIARLL